MEPVSGQVASFILLISVSAFCCYVLNRLDNKLDELEKQTNTILDRFKT